MRAGFVTAVIVLASWAGWVDAADPPAAQRPNIVYIFADDMGWGTGQFNNPSSPVETPHLNQLAADGLNFDRHYSATVCSPSRAMLMTGFHTGHTSNDRNGNIGQGIRDVEVTVAETLSTAGYATSVFGKWGWGGSGGSGVLRPNPTINNVGTLPQNQGFDEFYGYLNHGRAHSYQVDSLWTNVEPFDENGNGIDEVGEKYQPNQDNGLWLEKTGNNAADTTAAYTHDLIGVKSEQYIRDNVANGEPFYMQVNYTIPHFDLEAIVNTNPLLDLDGNVIHAGGLAQYATNAAMSDKERKHAAMISRMDASIGSLVGRLEDPNGDGDTSDSVLDNTIVMFSSDNGPTPEDGLGTAGIDNLDLAGGLRGGKRDLFEGGIRSPLLVRWDAQIDAGRRGTVDSTPTDLADFVATASELAGTSTPVGIDGVSLAPTILGTGVQRTGKVILSENFENSTTGNRRSSWTLIRGDQKLIKFTDGGFGLYDLSADLTESNALDLGLPANLAVKEELEAIALAEGAGRADNYFAEYAAWNGGTDTNFSTPENWSLGTAPANNWSTVVSNTSGVPERLAVNESVAVLGLELRGDNGELSLDVAPGKTLTARNEVRVGAGTRIELAQAELSTFRWIDVAAGGQVSGQGSIDGNVYNAGILAPGRAADLPDPNTEPTPLSELAPRDLDTGSVTLVDFDFTGVQDDAPLTQVNTLEDHVQIVEGFNFGPATEPRNAANAGDEFNVQGFSTGTTLESALSGDNYLTFSLQADEGAGLRLESVSVDLWRNGFNAAENYALFTSIGGFAVEDVLTELNLDEGVSGSANTETLTGSLSSGGMPTTDPVEVRIYGWGSNGFNGNTHFNAVSATGQVVAIPTWELDFTGIQDNVPVTAITPGSSENLVLVNGLDLGSGLITSTDGAAGDELNVEGWSTGTTLESATASNDYLGFTVQSVSGLTMKVDSVTFRVWRDAADSPNNFAILSNLDDGSAGASSDTFTVTTTGEANTAELVGVFNDTETTQDPVEFRLYGWNASSASGNAHLTGVSLRAQFQTVVDITLDPTGFLSIEGDLHHLEGGMIALELGGSDNSDLQAAEHDQLLVDGEVTLEGDLSLELVDGFTPSRGQSFELLTATSVLGEFANVIGDTGDEQLAFALVYESDRVVAFVTTLLNGDFNADGKVDAADYTVWRDSEGTSVTAYTGADGDGNGLVDASDYSLWKANYGQTVASFLAQSVPEPSGAVLVLVSTAGGLQLRRAEAHAKANFNTQKFRLSRPEVTVDEPVAP